MDKRNRDKIIGSVALLFIAVVFLIIGYFISKPKKSNYTDVFSKSSNQVQKCSLIYTQDKNDVHEEENSSIDETNDSNQEQYIMVDIKGAINNPGAYKLKNGSRVEDLVKLAGGFTEDADKVTVHLSKKLYDEDYVYIKKKGEKDRQDLPINEEKKTNIKNDLLSSTKKININLATLEELITLPGIGKVKARSIIDYRREKGMFKSIDDLLNVKGIGNSTLNSIKDLIVVK